VRSGGSAAAAPHESSITLGNARFRVEEVFDHQAILAFPFGPIHQRAAHPPRTVITASGTFLQCGHDAHMTSSREQLTSDGVHTVTFRSGDCQTRLSATPRAPSVPSAATC
jgi:hypothetical protein